MDGADGGRGELTTSTCSSSWWPSLPGALSYAASLPPLAAVPEGADVVVGGGDTLALPDWALVCAVLVA